MNELKQAHTTEQNFGVYVSPEIKAIDIAPEGVLCSSGLTQEFKEQDYSNGRFWD